MRESLIALRKAVEQTIEKEKSEAKRLSRVRNSFVGQ